jgi:hypothetical protein
MIPSRVRPRTTRAPCHLATPDLVKGAPETDGSGKGGFASRMMDIKETATAVRVRPTR